jgi:hypothetical protein
MVGPGVVCIREAWRGYVVRLPALGEDGWRVREAGTTGDGDDARAKPPSVAAWGACECTTTQMPMYCTFCRCIGQRHLIGSKHTR